MEENHLGLALLNVVLSVVVGFIAVWGGIIAARAVEGKPVMESAAYAEFEQGADAGDPQQRPGAERDIRDATIEPKRRA